MYAILNLWTDVNGLQAQVHADGIRDVKEAEKLRIDYLLGYPKKDPQMLIVVGYTP